MEFKNGINADKEYYWTGYSFINVLDILNNNYIYHDVIIWKVNISSDLFTKSNVCYGDVLFQRSSETREEVGTANVYLDKNKTATFGWFVIRGKKIWEYDPIFISKLLKTKSARKSITSRSWWSTRYNVGQDTLSTVELYFPELLEQERIWNFLFSIDEKIEKLREKKSLLETYKKWVMQQIFAREIRFKDESGEEYPEWEEKKLGEIATIKSWSSKTEYIEQNGKNIIVDMWSIWRSWLLIWNKKTNFSDDFLSISDLIMAKDDIWWWHIIGKVVQIPENNKYIFGDHIYKLSITKWCTSYIYYAINSYEINKSFRRQASWTAQIWINNGVVNNQKIPFPSLTEQIKIASFLSEIDAEIATMSLQIEQAEQWKKGLLQGMFV